MLLSDFRTWQKWCLLNVTDAWGRSLKRWSSAVRTFSVLATVDKLNLNSTCSLCTAKEIISSETQSRERQCLHLQVQRLKTKAFCAQNWSYVCQRNCGQCSPPGGTGPWSHRPHQRRCCTDRACTEAAACGLGLRGDHPCQKPPKASWWRPIWPPLSRSPGRKGSPGNWARGAHRWRTVRAQSWTEKAASPEMLIVFPGASGAQIKRTARELELEWLRGPGGSTFYIKCSHSVLSALNPWQTAVKMLFGRKCKSPISECKGSLMAALTRCEHPHVWL